MKNAAPWSDPRAHLMRQTPDAALLYFSPDRLQATARAFQAGFPGLVTYAVKANPGAEVLANLVAAGITAFDVASPEEMRAVRAVCPRAVLHYNNPVRSLPEIEVAAQMGVASYSIDCLRELDKLTGRIASDAEITVRLALPVRGAAYDFGAKFGVGPDRAEELLRAVAQRGFTPSMTFHPGTQCADPAAWGAYIGVVADVARRAGVRLARINVGGGFAAHRTGNAPDLTAIFTHIGAEVARVFGADAPALVCEPGRAMVAEAFSLAVRVKALRDSGAIFLNDGVYGGLTEIRDIGAPDRITVLAPDGTPRHGAPSPRVVFGPTCDSIDRLPDPLPLPEDLAEGDYLLISGMGAYTRCLSTDFNGYGLREVVTVAQL
ncbi:Diaminopimelate decarboxylase [Roseovarius mucosus DSM 17069]|uniref:ornithine decarboxylase n=1 Tax=Roseovarius mucosus DSM 17069 TaxID=1288298 RepID=A0A0A0HQI4_9RHOB|nr:type III PLP-dependent enzyme [Roseovarius mucosus]KGM88313.1 Diaminopimelate decarboxylase [Roseovarius mucosus DSM 17069]